MSINLTCIKQYQRITKHIYVKKNNNEHFFWLTKNDIPGLARLFSAKKHPNPN